MEAYILLIYAMYLVMSYILLLCPLSCPFFIIYLKYVFKFMFESVDHLCTYELWREESGGCHFGRERCLFQWGVSL